MTCPRCGKQARPPGAWSNRWICREHGEIYPLHPVKPPNARFVRELAARSPLPLWLPWPLPQGWVISAVMQAGDDVSGVHATGVVVSGRSPLGGAADMLIIAEEQGVGLGAGFAQAPGTDPGDVVKDEPNARVEASGRLVPLWWVDTPNRAVYAGQTGGRWLWAVLVPESAGHLLVEDVVFSDIRDLGHEVELLPFGTPPSWIQRAAE